LRVDNSIGVHLFDEDEVPGADANGARNALTILGDRCRVVPDVEGKVERRVGPRTHPSETVGDEGVNAQAREGRCVVDSKRTALLGEER
jgi:hypothetical protein